MKSKLKKTNTEFIDFRNIPETYNLIGIQSLISPSLLYALANSGWEDEISIVDSTFPAETIANDTCNSGKVIRMDGIPIVPLVREIMKLWQLDKTDPLAILVNENETVSIREFETVVYVTFI